MDIQIALLVSYVGLVKALDDNKTVPIGNVIHTIEEIHDVYVKKSGPVEGVDSILRLLRDVQRLENLGTPRTRQ
ncbi:hypothetical protein IAG25_35495 [Caballeronia sp. EK]|uniref:hypothetical protein n=1 Tax=Caballeronia sp. EK TaxID=2767469 RepID=UPI0016556272|nr:hypothetical protein [Caballeronia sp. EK]MBC8642113.1 hypothetical protein [Caballeronia sp. EK]